MPSCCSRYVPVEPFVTTVFVHDVMTKFKFSSTQCPNETSFRACQHKYELSRVVYPCYDITTLERQKQNEGTHVKRVRQTIFIRHTYILTIEMKSVQEQKPEWQKGCVLSSTSPYPYVFVPMNRPSGIVLSRSKLNWKKLDTRVE